MITNRTKRVLACALLLCVSCVTAQGNTLQELLTCADIERSQLRLDCYDTLARASAPNTVETIGSWIVRTGADPVDGSSNVYLSTEATAGGTQTASGNPQVFWLRCLQGEIRAFVTWQDFLGTGTIQTTYRIGTADSVTDTWYIGADGEAVFYSYNRPANLEFIDRLVQADNGTLTAQITPTGQSTQMATFDISGLRRIIDRIYGACREPRSQ